MSKQQWTLRKRRGALRENTGSSFSLVFLGRGCSHYRGRGNSRRGGEESVQGVCEGRTGKDNARSTPRDTSSFSLLLKCHRRPKNSSSFHWFLHIFKKKFVTAGSRSVLHDPRHRGGGYQHRLLQHQAKHLII